MIRTVVYRCSKKPGSSQADGSPIYGRRSAAAEGLAADNVIERVAKYVPGETLAIILPGTLIFTEHWAVVALAVAGLIGTPMWMRKRAQAEQPADQQPPKRFYLVGTLAYIAWVVAASSPLRQLWGIDEQVAGFLLFAAAYFLPLVDDRLDKPPAS